MQQVSWEWAERGFDNRPFRFVEHISVVDEPYSALHVVQRMTGKRSPGRLDREKTKTGPRIDSDAAVFQLSDNIVPVVGELTLGLRVYDDICTERAMQILIAIRNGIAQIALGVRATNPCHTENRREDFHVLCI